MHCAALTIMAHALHRTTIVDLPQLGIGARHQIQLLDWAPKSTSIDYAGDDQFFELDRAYIQASLHADELPGMLVAHHLIKLLDIAAARDGILKPITVVPYANPLGLNQILLGGQVGRFSFTSGVNFNRDWSDVTSAVKEAVAGKLDPTDGTRNAAIIRKAMWEEAHKISATKVDKVMKSELFKRACLASLVLDLHCDGDAVMHMYTHERLWPEMQDVAQFVGSRCNLVAPMSGGNPFDEAFSEPWACLADAFPFCAVPMACHSATIELRGEQDVCDSLAEQDAVGLYCLLVKRGYIRDEAALASFSPPPSCSEAVPLTGVDNIECPCAGVLAWKVSAGDHVTVGQLLGEVVRVDDVDAPRVPIVARTAGLVYGMKRSKLSVPGDMAIKIAGASPLTWRKGNLLSAK